MEVPFLNLDVQTRTLWPEIQQALEPVIGSAQFILGPAVERFERQLAQYLGVRHCIGVNSGTSALHLALLANDIGPGAEVITTPHTWISTVWAISYVGATPVFADIDPVTWTIDPEQVQRALTPRTRAILPVHLYGQTADLGGLARLAREKDLVLIEDAAQAHGARWNGQCVGTIGQAGCFSFYPGKNLGAFGEAGAVVTNNDEVARRIRCLRDHAQAQRHHHVEIGFNMRMDGIQGAVLDVKLRHLNAWNAARARHAHYYQELLADFPGLVVPTAPHGAEGHVWHLFVVLLPEGTREAVRQALAAQGVATGIHYPTPVHFQPAYAHLDHRPGSFPVAEKVASRCLSLPMFPELTEEQQRWTVAALLQALSSASPSPTQPLLV